MMIKKFIYFIFLIFITIPLVGAKPKKGSKKGKIVEINFDDELLIKGKLLGPSLFTLYQKRDVEFGKLIKPRKDFLPEMRATLGDIK